MRLPSTSGGGSKLLLPLFGCLPVAWLAVLFAQAVSPGMNLAEMMDALTVTLSNPFSLAWTERTAKCILLFLLAYGITIGVYASNQRNYRRREEHGSAVWGDVNGIVKRYQAPKYEDNLLLTKRFRMGLDGHKHRRNLNILVVGGSGAGKTRGYAKPNIIQCSNCSYLVTDPKGEILRATGNLLKARGYDVRVFDLINPEASMCYNPFRYISDDKDVLKLISNLIKNTTPKGAHESDPFWTKAETALLQALMLYLVKEAPEDEQNFAMILEMIASADVREEDESYQGPLDLLFERLEARDPQSIAVKQYRVFKQAAGKTAKSILVAAGVRLAAFNLPQIAGLTCVDEMRLEDLGEKKVALFCCIPDSDPSLNYLVGLLYSQCFQTLYQLADRKYGGRLPVHVHAVMDEWANISLPDDFEKLLATMRSREISVSIIVQNIAQIKALFKDSWESIIGNCDSLLYLGGNEASTHEYLSKALGKETLDTNTYGQSKGRSGSYSTNWQQTGRELLQPDEIRKLDNRYAILLLRGEPPMLDEKYDLLSHPNIRMTADGGAPIYDHTLAPRAKDDVILDPDRYDDYEILDADAILDNNEKESNSI
jgi:type IV secretion system protein VirD4